MSGAEGRGSMGGTWESAETCQRRVPGEDRVPNGT